MGTVTPLRPGERLVVCIKAPPGRMSCHVDGAKLEDEPGNIMIGICGVVLDEHYHFSMSFYERCPDLQDQGKAELRAIKKATTVLKEGESPTQTTSLDFLR